MFEKLPIAFKLFLYLIKVTTKFEQLCSHVFLSAVVMLGRIRNGEVSGDLSCQTPIHRSSYSLPQIRFLWAPTVNELELCRYE